MKPHVSCKIIIPILTLLSFLIQACTGSSGDLHPKPRIVVDESICPAIVSGEDAYFSDQLDRYYHESRINIKGLWEIEGLNHGKGINIAIVDDGLEVAHYDLCGNIDFKRNYNYLDGTNDTTPDSYLYYHGTGVAGIPGALYYNSIGVSGVAPEATLVGFNLLNSSAGTAVNTYDALTRNLDTIDIYNNSWGPNDDGEFHSLYSFVKDAIREGLATGRNGKGAIYVWANGNGGSESDRSTYDGFASFYGVIPVGGITDSGTKASFSEPGSNLWVVTYSYLYTTDIYNRYDSYFAGTSAAAPLASGIIALMLDANPNLTWRDVKLILAKTADKNDEDDDEWTTNDAGYNINYKYGFGNINAFAAVTQAKNWTNVGPMLTFSKTHTEYEAIPDSYPDGIEQSIVIDSSETAITQIEYVTIETTLAHPSGGELEIVLTSAKDTENIMTKYHTLNIDHDNDSSTPPITTTDYFKDGNTFTFGTARNLGESPVGAWTLTIKDLASTDSTGGILKSWKLTIYGRE